MKNHFLPSALIALTIGLITFSSCKKLTYADLSSAQDAVNVGFHMNAIMDDAANVVSRTATLSGSTAAIDTVAGGTVDTTLVASGQITINYDGTTVVDGRFIHSGSISIQLNNFPGSTRWTDAQSQLNLYFHHVKFTNVASGHSYTYEGPAIMINTLGGLAYQMLDGVPAAVSLGSIQYNLRSTGIGDTVVFTDDTLRVWGFNRIRVYTNTQNTPEIGVSSTFSINGYNNVDMWGTDHSGNGFDESIISSNSYNSGITFNNLNCSNNFRDARGGEAKVYEQQFAIDMGFGATSSNNGAVAFNCPYGFKTTYVNSRNNFVEAESPYWY